jgi:hypothetical protein
MGSLRSRSGLRVCDPAAGGLSLCGHLGYPAGEPNDNASRRGPTSGGESTPVCYGGGGRARAHVPRACHESIAATACGLRGASGLVGGLFHRVLKRHAQKHPAKSGHPAPCLETRGSQGMSGRDNMDRTGCPQPVCEPVSAARVRNGIFIDQTGAPFPIDSTGNDGAK